MSENREVYNQYPIYRLFLHAKDWIKGRSKEFEKEFLEDDGMWYHLNLVIRYALEVIKGRWPEGEKAIIDLINDPDEKMALWMRESEIPLQYALNVIGGRWPEVEHNQIMKSDWRIVKYALEVIKGRWPEGEKVLLDRLDNDDPTFRNGLLHICNRYAQNVIKGRWPEMEAIVAKHMSD